MAWFGEKRRDETELLRRFNELAAAFAHGKGDAQKYTGWIHDVRFSWGDDVASQIDGDIGRFLARDHISAEPLGEFNQAAEKTRQLLHKRLRRTTLWVIVLIVSGGILALIQSLPGWVESVTGHHIADVLANRPTSVATKSTVPDSPGLMAARSSQGSAALLEAFLAQSEDAMKNRQNDRALEVIKLAKTEADKMPSTPSGVQLLMRLGALCEQLDQRSCADNAYTRSLDDSRRLFGDRTTQVGAALRALAGHNASSDRCEDARAQYKELLAMTDDTDEKGNILSQLAFVDSWCQFPEDTQEDHDSRSVEAAALLEQALKMKEALHGKNNPEVLALAVQLGQLRNMTQDYQGAIVALERLVDAGGNPLFDPDHVLSLLGRSYAATGNLEKAEMEYGQWVKLREGAVGRDHPACQEPLEHLATVFTREGKYHEAEGAWHRVREICENELRVHPQARMRTIPSCVDALEGLGSLAAKQKRYSEAERLLNQALSLGKEGPTSGRRGTLLALARLYADRKQVEKADSFYRRRIQAGITDPSTLMEYVEFLKRNHRDAEADKVLADAKEFVAAFEKRTGRSVLHPE